MQLLMSFKIMLAAEVLMALVTLRKKEKLRKSL
jgi:hypothetical protein